MVARSLGGIGGMTHVVASAVLILALLGLCPAQRVVAVEVPQASEPDCCETASDAEVVAKAIAQLGSAKYAEREAAQRALLGMGIVAREALLAARKSPDAEVRRRSTSIVAATTTTGVRYLIDRFDVSTPSPCDARLPGWTRFADLVGNTLETREFFRDMVLSDLELFSQLAAHPDRVFDLLSASVDRAFATPRDQTLSYMARFFLGTDPKSARPERYVQSMQIWASGEQLTASLQSAKRQEIARKLLRAWLEHEQRVSAEMLSQLWRYAKNWNEPASENILAGRYLGAAAGDEATLERFANPPFRKLPHFVIEVLTRLQETKSRDHTSHIERLLDQSDVGLTDSVTFISAEVRDVALATLLLREDKNPEEFGLVLGKMNNSPVAAVWYFPHPVVRQNGLRKYFAERQWTDRTVGSVPATTPAESKTPEFVFYPSRNVTALPEDPTGRLRLELSSDGLGIKRKDGMPFNTEKETLTISLSIPFERVGICWSFSGDGKYLAVGTSVHTQTPATTDYSASINRTGTLAVYDLTTGAQPHLNVLVGPVSAVTFRPPSPLAPNMGIIAADYEPRYVQSRTRKRSRTDDWGK